MANTLFLGIDVGGTKISAALINRAGKIYARNKITTPARATNKEIIALLSRLILETLAKAAIKTKKLKGIGIGIPGIVDSKTGAIITTPNLKLSGTALAHALKIKFKCPVVLGNDVNLGVLGEKWMGAASTAENIVGIFPGTGIGGGVIINGKLLTGTHGAGAELGHIIMDITGPQCTCGNKGCLEALTGRWAIERDIRTALSQGEKSVISSHLQGPGHKIKSSALREALQKKDPLVTAIMKRVSEILALACISLRHTFDPQLIVFGGGLIEACGDFLLPRIQKAVKADPFFAGLENFSIVESLLGDDAVVLGAGALIQQHLGLSLSPLSLYPIIRVSSSGAIKINNKSVPKNIYIRADGKIKKFEAPISSSSARTCPLDVDSLQKICKRSPRTLIVGTSSASLYPLTAQGKVFLKKEGIDFKSLPLKEAVSFYNEVKKRKAILLGQT